MLLQSAPGTTHSVRRPAQKRSIPSMREIQAAGEMELPALTEDDEVFIALANYDLMRRLEEEPL